MHAIDTKLIVNPYRIRDSVRRLFEDTPARVMGELLQNAEQGGASFVNIYTNLAGFSCQDNGHGSEGIRGFYQLLCLADFNFSDWVEKDQSPLPTF